MSRSEALQSLCRDYLGRLRNLAERHGLLSFVDDTIRRNLASECVATEDEVAFLSRCVDDERVSRTDVPEILGKSYRKANANGDFKGLSRLRRVGIYSKVSALLLKAELEENKQQDK